MNDLGRPAIPSVPPGVQRPRWSVMIPTYNCAGLLRQTLQSVLSQDPGPDVMQVEVVDDHSTHEDPEAVVREFDNGRIGFFRQTENVGHVRNFNTCLARARGHLVHLLHGDDLVLPGFYDRMGRAFEEAPGIGAVFSRPLMTDEGGKMRYLFPLEQKNRGQFEGGVAAIAVKQRIVPPAIVVRRGVYEALGGFDPRIRFYGEDWEMWVRIAASYPVWYEPEPLALYRIRHTSLSGTSIQTGDNLADVARAIEAFKHHLPHDGAEPLAARARKWAALQALKRARRQGRAGDAVTAIAQLRGALRLSSAPLVLLSAAAATPHVLWGVGAALAVGVRSRIHGGSVPSEREPFPTPRRRSPRAMILRLRRLAIRALRSLTRSKERYLRAHQQPRLHLGSGGNTLAGWLNTDLYPRSREVVYLDVRRRFPFADSTFDYVYAEHMIEHVRYSEGRHLLSEAFRVLRPGGRIRIATPDLQFLLDLYREEPSALQKRYLAWSTEEFSGTAPFPSPAFVINTFFRAWGHTFIYDQPILEDALRRSGFVDVERCRLGESSDPALRNLELVRRLPEGFLELETLVVEGRKGR